MNNEKLFRFNPFTIKDWTDEEVKLQYEALESSLSFEETPFHLARDIDIYANMGYLIGEMVARYYEIVGNTESKLKVDVSNAIYRFRNEWSKTSQDKVPAMSYFENKAQSMFLDETMELTKKESMLKRFKFASESIESKQNALKKKLESFKYDALSR